MICLIIYYYTTLWDKCHKTVISRLIWDQNVPLKYHTHAFHVCFIYLYENGKFTLKDEMMDKHWTFCNITEKRLVSKLFYLVPNLVPWSIWSLKFERKHYLILEHIANSFEFVLFRMLKASQNQRHIYTIWRWAT